MFGKSSEVLKCSKLSTKKVARWSYELKYQFLKNQKNRFSKKWLFFSVFQKKMNIFLNKKWHSLCVNTTVTDTHCVQYMSQESFVSHRSTHIHTIGQYLVNILSTLSIIWSTIFKHLPKIQNQLNNSWSSSMTFRGSKSWKNECILGLNIYEIHLIFSHILLFHQVVWISW